MNFSDMVTVLIACELILLRLSVVNSSMVSPTFYMVSPTFYRIQYVDSDYDKPDGAQLILSKSMDKAVSTNSLVSVSCQL